MKTNKLGIPITENNHIDGHVINKYEYYNSNRISYFRAFKSIRPYFINAYGILLKKIYKYEKK